MDEIQRSPVEVGSLSRYLRRFLYIQTVVQDSFHQQYDLSSIHPSIPSIPAPWYTTFRHMLRHLLHLHLLVFAGCWKGRQFFPQENPESWSLEKNPAKLTGKGDPIKKKTQGNKKKQQKTRWKPRTRMFTRLSKMDQLQWNHGAFVSIFSAVFFSLFEIVEGCRQGRMTWQ